MKYAIARIGGHQYKIEEGKEVLVDRDIDPQAEVLMVVDGEKATIGTPVVEGAKVSLKIIGDEKGEKIEVFKYKSKSRYRKHIGYRHSHTRVLVESITSK
jgi:large subunit ribosomal protein L21